MFSAALCRGLIEALQSSAMATRKRSEFSAALCRGLIEAREACRCGYHGQYVFRGFMPRPH